MQTPELIAVRPDEGFDEDRLAAYLQDHLPGASGRMDVDQFAGGHANLTYRLSFEDVEYVLRRPPLGPVAPGSHDMGREHRVLSRLWQSFPLAPRSYLFCDDRSVIGAPFFVMERRHGVVIRNDVPSVFGGGSDEPTNRKLSEVVIDTLVDFHAVDPEQAGFGDLGRPEGFMERQLDGWGRRWEAARIEDNPLADELIGWLKANQPVSPPPTLIHNDWRLDNMAIAESDPGRCVAVYDWDMCTQGDPLADLGTLLAVWYSPEEIPTELNPMPTAAPGFMDRHQAIERYASATGRHADQMTYYVVFGSFKMAVVLQQIYLRYHLGQTEDERFAVMGAGAAHLFELAATRRGG